jgi:predicted branched-subunit amino acid permease
MVVSDDPLSRGAAEVAAAVRARLGAGAAAAIGAPALASAVSFLAFGAAAEAAELGLAWTLTATFLVYGMAGQLVLLDGAQAPTAGGSSLEAAMVTVFGATAANARLMPMAVTLAPLLAPEGGQRRRHLLLLAPFVALTPWVAAMRELPGLPRAERAGWFLGFALATWAIVGMAAWIGHAAATALEPPLLAVLVFLNPLFFALSIATEVRRREPRLAIIAGGVAALACLDLGSGWGVLAGGLVGGTLAWGMTLRGREAVHE